MTIRVLLADDHVLFAQTLSGLLAEKYDIVEIVSDGKALQTAARKHQPDVIVTDITMPFMSGLESVRSLRKSSCTSKIIFLTMHVDAELARECFNSGGSAFVNKESAFEELIAAIEAVVANHQYLSPKVPGRARSREQGGSARRDLNRYGRVSSGGLSIDVRNGSKLDEFDRDHTFRRRNRRRKRIVGCLSESSACCQERQYHHSN